jgi:hypothetical protein
MGNYINHTSMAVDARSLQRSKKGIGNVTVQVARRCHLL